LQTIQVLFFRVTQQMEWLEKITIEPSFNNSRCQHFMANEYQFFHFTWLKTYQ